MSVARFPVVVLLATTVAACAGRITPEPPAAGPVAPSAGRNANATDSVAHTDNAADIRITILHLNDLYEITPTAGGRRGGPARVATLRRRLLEANPHTYTVLAGDLLSPSALGTARVDGQRLDGRQMVAVLNAMGLDFATFGNHEFDLSEASFGARLRESRFRWVSANVGDTLPNTSRHVIVRVSGNGGEVRIAFFGLTMDRDQRPWARVADPIAAAEAEVAALRDSADIIIAITHLPIAQDIRLAEEIPAIDLVLGGHEHENLALRRGDDLTPIAKADANARTVYVHELRWAARERSLVVESRLVEIDERLEADARTDSVVGDWVGRAYAGFRQSGFEPDSVVATSTLPLDGLESSVLHDTTALSNTIGEAMRSESGGAPAIFNAGSIRLDDVLPPGTITQYDLIRILPFGGPIVEVEMRGSLLRRTLEQGQRNRGTGGFVQRSGIRQDAGGDWLVDGERLDDARTYRIAVTEFLISGREQGMDWLNREHPELRVIRELRDIRFALLDALRRRFGPPARGAPEAT